MKEYKRLTRKNANGEWVAYNDAECCIGSGLGSDGKYYYLGDPIDKLAEFEDAIESGDLLTKEEHLKRCLEHREQAKVDAFAELNHSGKFVELPCKVGDTIYYIEYFCKYKGCTSEEQQFCCGCKEMLERERNNEKYVIRKKKFALNDLSSIGKKYFMTKSQAEAKLKELEGKK